MRRLISITAVTLLALGTVHKQLDAAPVFGTLVASGSATLKLTSLAFLCTANGTGSQPCPGGYGNFAATSNSTGSFAPYGSVADAGFIEGLNFSSIDRINQPFSAPNYLVFSSGGSIVNPDISLSLNFVAPGSDSQTDCGTAAMAGQVCTPVIPALVQPANPNGLSELNLMNTSSSSSSISFNVNGTALRISTGEVSPITGTFRATLSGSSLQDVLSALSAPNGSVPVDYLFSFTAPTPAPEPGTFVIGVIAIAAVITMRRRGIA